MEGKVSVWVGDGTPTEEMESYVLIYTLDYIKKDAKLGFLPNTCISTTTQLLYFLCIQCQVLCPSMMGRFFLNWYWSIRDHLVKHLRVDMEIKNGVECNEMGHPYIMLEC